MSCKVTYKGIRFNSEKDLQEYLYNTLSKVGKKATSAMKVKVALSKNFEPLLKAKHIDGTPIGDIKRLNQMLKNERWLNTGDNRAMISLSAVRIPVQGMNSMEFMEVYQFLDPSAGSVIVPPTEIVTKSGADFDVDKMTVMMPSLSIINGVPELYKRNTTKDTEEVLKEKKKNKLEEINTIEKKYDELFDNRKAKEEYSFSTEEWALIKEKTESIKSINKEINKVKKDWSEYAANKTEATKPILEKLEQQLLDLEIKKNAERENRAVYISGFNTALSEKRTEELKKVREELGNIQRGINSYSEKAIQNDIMHNIRNILSLPQNFESLITPNSTDLLDDLASELKGEMDYNPLENVNHETGEEISPTRILDYEYNLYKHMSNAVGKETLGLGAVDNTYNALFNRIGAHMMPASLSKKEYESLQRRAKAGTLKKGTKDLKKLESYTKQTILLPHNTVATPEGRGISLSHTHAAEGSNKIADIINQMMNGWVDVAKDAWIFNIQGNKQISPVLLFMVQAGVPIDQAVYFVSNPLIKEYVKQQKIIGSTLAGPLNNKPSNPNFVKYEAKKAVFNNKKNGFKGMDKVSNAIINKMSTNLNNGKAFTKNEVKDRAFAKSRKSVDSIDRSIFLHYLQLEEMSKSVRDVKMRTNVDTSRDVSLFEAQDRLRNLDDLEGDSRLDPNIVKKIKENSPIGSFFIQDFQIELLSDLFTLRNHPTINEFIDDHITQELEQATYTTKEATVSNWKSDLINYIFQNELRYIDLNHLEHYKGRRLLFNKEESNLDASERAVLKHGLYIKDNVVHVDQLTLEAQFKEGTYSRAEYWHKLGYAQVHKAMFLTKESYFSFVLERENLRNNISREDALATPLYQKLMEKFKIAKPQQKDMSDEDYDKFVHKYVYEMYLRDEALRKSFNHHYMFKGDQSYAKRFEEIRSKYTNLKEAFKLFDVIDVKMDMAFKNLRLNNTKLTQDEINILHENLNDLTNPAKIKELMPDITKAEVKEITDFFNDFETVAILQSGMNQKSSFALTSIVSQDKMVRLTEPAVKNFLEGLDSKTESAMGYLKKFTNKFKETNSVSQRSSRVRGKNMSENLSWYSHKGLKNMNKEKIDDSHLLIGKTENDVAVGTMSTLTPDAAKGITSTDKGNVYVYGLAITNTRNATHGDQLFHGLPHTYGLTSQHYYSMPANQGIDPHIIKDTEEGTIDETIKEAIDNDIASLLEESEDRQIVFSREGYGQTMLQKNKAGTMYGKETFLYLSKQLFDNFGYINPGFLDMSEGMTYIQTEQAIDDVEIDEVTDSTLNDLMNNCI